ncbi:uncharacterized protein BX663DRAFT_500610 [Cokeromyces recurvatus]|uniref:uncharacterized protein n=1 Tax=Cokeromyces recurvatus TaxID=90255 RepID=UPI00221E3E0E|nr:uncharacterized protein BX663DRAFT_500610 [Cokeromyces recurvatus]KAI7905701.1 hypothetical protein BX663DRAFT_500610 [Cokeromyces recurvatus]
MLKNQGYMTTTTTTNKQQCHSNSTTVYDKVNQDLFQQNPIEKNKKIPSITTIFLLQLQAHVIKRLVELSKKKRERRIQHWILLILLVLLDNIARILNIENEMNKIRIIEEEEEDHHAYERDKKKGSTSTKKRFNLPQQQKLRRITGQREMSMHTCSSKETNLMKGTLSFTTKNQHQKPIISKPYERCCSACTITNPS